MNLNVDKLKGLTPQEFEDRYLGRSEKPVEAAEGERKSVKKILADPKEVFRVDEGSDARMQAYYDEAFDEAFEGISENINPTDSVAMKRLSAAKNCKKRLIAWGKMVPQEDHFFLDRGRRPDGEASFAIMFYPNHFDEADTDHFYQVCDVEEGKQPFLVLLPEPVSREFAAINLAGGLIHLMTAYRHMERNEEVETSRLFQETEAAYAQICLASHMTDNVFASNVASIMDYDGISSIEEWVRGLGSDDKRNLALMNLSLTKKNDRPPESKSEELARIRLFKMASLLYWAKKMTGKKAEHETFIALYKRYRGELGIRFRYVDWV